MHVCWIVIETGAELQVPAQDAVIAGQFRAVTLPTETATLQVAAAVPDQGAAVIELAGLDQQGAIAQFQIGEAQVEGRRTPGVGVHLVADQHQGRAFAHRPLQVGAEPETHVIVRARQYGNGGRRARDNHRRLDEYRLAKTQAVQAVVQGQAVRVFIDAVQGRMVRDVFNDDAAPGLQSPGHRGALEPHGSGQGGAILQGTLDE